MKYFKHTYKIKFFIPLAVLFVLQSCTNFLEQEPGTQVSITEQLGNKQGVLEALSGLYMELEANVRGDRFAVYADMQGGNLKFTPNATGSQGAVKTNAGEITIPTNIRNVYSFDDASNDSDYKLFYDNSYDIINQCNLILEFTDALNDATQIEKNQIKAEALTIRAYTHFLLSEIYSQHYGFTNDASHIGIIYNTESINKGLRYPARETVAQTYSLIIADITTALNWYSSNAILPGPSYSYFNISSAKSLLSRVYLYKKDWENAYNTANNVITTSGVTLMSTTNYITQWEKQDTPVSEILLEFSIPTDDSGNVGSSMSAHFGYISKTTFSKYVATQDLLSLYAPTDIRKQMFLEKPLTTLINNQQVDVNYYFTKKFQGNAGYVAFRLSEQYLIRAEAALQLGNITQAKTDINTIRQRANASLVTDTENLEEAIFLERQKELCFEGHLFFDMLRNKKNIVRNNGCLSLNCNVAYPSPKFILPIPSINTNINTNLKQNESYN